MRVELTYLVLAGFAVVSVFYCIRWFREGLHGTNTRNTKSSQHSGSMGLLFLVAFLAALAYGVANKLMDIGWMPHSQRASVVYPSHGWEVGEHIQCEGAGPLGAGVSLDCSGGVLRAGPTRDMDITFWGGIREQVQWFDCRRDSDRITCHLAAPPSQPLGPSQY